ncbi:MAG TPA: response regulator transcription factor [Chloroflexia bacterium]|nr:response regulator transcription factor [Chloroflexia bacterium]
MSETIRVVLADDHPLLRAGVAATLAAESDIEVVGQGGSADEAVQLVQEWLPDVILLDIHMPGSGLEAAATIAATCPVTRVVMLTVSADEDDLLAALKVGARGYVLKGAPGHELVRVVRSVCGGESYVPPALAAALLRGMSSGPPAGTPVDPLQELTAREHEILEGVATGRSNKEIAASLFLSEKTVKHYMTNILQKLQVRNRVEAALLARRSRLN